MNEPKPPFWKNPFVIGFAVGVAMLTALPLLQRRFLKAPPPLRPMGAWDLVSSTGQNVSAASLRGRVFVAQVLPSRCDAVCKERVELQASLVRHLEDLKVVQVTVVVPVEGTEPFPKELLERAGPGWLMLGGEAGPVARVVEGGLQAALRGWGRADAGANALEFSSLPSFSLVDQNGDVRGFWMQDETGRGNLINAARLLAKHGASP